SRATNSTFTESFEQRRGPEPVSHVCAKFCSCPAKEVSNRTIACYGTLSFPARQRTWSVRAADAIRLPASSNGEAQTIAQKGQLILTKHRERALTIRGVIESVE